MPVAKSGRAAGKGVAVRKRSPGLAPDTSMSRNPNGDNLKPVHGESIPSVQLPEIAIVNGTEPNGSVPSVIVPMKSTAKFPHGPGVSRPQSPNPNGPDAVHDQTSPPGVETGSPPISPIASNVAVKSAPFGPVYVTLVNCPASSGTSKSASAEAGTIFSNSAAVAATRIARHMAHLTLTTKFRCDCAPFHLRFATAKKFEPSKRKVPNYSMPLENRVRITTNAPNCHWNVL
jgi:hypothetical protein